MNNLLSVFASGLLLTIIGTAQAAPAPADTSIKILAINDFHGQMTPVSFATGVPNTANTPAGGIDYLAGYIADYRARFPNTIVVSAGDLVGATPLVSALFHDEGTIETMNRAGLDINAVGNHEFDEGKEELLRMQRGGCHPTDPNSCQGSNVGTPTPFEGADFQFLAANVVEQSTGKTIFPPYAIRQFGRARVAFIGMTLESTPSIVTPLGVAGLNFLDEAETANALISRLKARGVKAIVVLIHEGGAVPNAQNALTINQCVGDLAGSPIRDIVGRLSNEVDLVITGHTHQAYNCQLPNAAGRLVSVTSANSIGRVMTDIDVVIDGRTRDVKSVAAHNIVVARDNPTITPNAEIVGIVNAYAAIATPIANRIIGTITATITRTANAAGESALGDVIADAQLAATRAANLGGAQIGLMNPGGIRADFSFASSPAGEGDGNVTYGEAFTTQPFGNSLVTLTLTGDQIHTLLEMQFTGCHALTAPASFNYPVTDIEGQPFNRIMQPSAGFTYEWNETGPACDKVDPTSIELNGTTVDPSAAYRVTVNSFLATGGDKIYVLAAGTERLGGALDLDALEAYFVQQGVVAPGPQDRIALIQAQ